MNWKFEKTDPKKETYNAKVTDGIDSSYSFNFNLEQNQPSKGVFNLYWWSANDPIYIA